MKKVITVNDNCQGFDGLRYFSDKKGRPYYRRTVKRDGKLTTVSLHRMVWEYFNEPIAKGKHVHHIDGDWKNNQISNLVLLDGHAHLSAHQKTPERQKQLRENMEKIRHLAVEWHKDPANKEFHRTIANKSWEDKKEYPITCGNCHAIHMTPFPSRTKYCSPNCKMRARTRRLKGLPEDIARNML